MYLADVPLAGLIPVMALVPLPFGRFGAYASTLRARNLLFSIPHGFC